MSAIAEQRGGARRTVLLWLGALALVLLGVIAIPVTAVNWARCVSPASAAWCLEPGAVFVAIRLEALIALGLAVASYFLARSGPARILGLIATGVVVIANVALLSALSIGVDGVRDVGGQSISLFVAIAVLVSGLLVGAASMLREAGVSTDGPSGVKAPEWADKGLDGLEAVGYYIFEWEKTYANARRVVKRRASKVTIWTTVITGAVAILGALSAALSDNLWVDLIGVSTTAASATAAVLLAWNQHFHHRELWVQRSGVLNEIQNLRLKYELASRRPWFQRPTKAHLARTLNAELQQILARDLESWTQIQGAKPHEG